MSDPTDFTRDLGCGFDCWLAEHQPGADLEFVVRSDAAVVARVWMEEYERRVQEVADEFVSSGVWQSTLHRLADLHDEYKSEERPLLAHPPVCPKPCALPSSPDPVVEMSNCTGHVTWKGGMSVREKLFRENRKKNFKPEEDGAGGRRPVYSPWALFDGGINDLVRTTIVVREFNGVEAVARIIDDATRDAGHDVVSATWKGSMAGYYAHHTQIRLPSESSPEGHVSVEVQVCTQMQEVLRSLTHKLYERRRCREEPDDSAWQRDPMCDEFTPNYLGHMLHFADGLIDRSYSEVRGSHA